MLSATMHSEVIEKYLAEESQLGRMLGPFSPADFPQVHINRFGVIPKSQPGKWRLITDLSYPPGASVNDGVSPELASLSYVTVDRVSEQIMQLGKGALMAKVDIRSAYRLIPVHPSDRLVLGVLWKGKLYVDSQLPFGLRSAPKIFTAIADAIEWCVRLRGVSFVAHYLDDFITFSPPASPVCGSNLALLSEECTCLGAALADEKSEGPTTLLPFLGN